MVYGNEEGDDVAVFEFGSLEGYLMGQGYDYEEDFETGTLSFEKLLNGPPYLPHEIFSALPNETLSQFFLLFYFESRRYYRLFYIIFILYEIVLF